MSKIKLNTNREEITSDEIKGRRDFNKILTNYKKLSKPFYKSPYFIVTGITITIGLVVIGYLNIKKDLSTSKISQTEIIDSVKSVKVNFINPAFNSISIPFERFTLLAESGGKLKLKTGSEIIIPKNAFYNESNQPVSGEIDILYREFRDPVDILVSGIPMKYDSAGLSMQLESAGMFEISGKQNGQNIKLSKNITVKLASSNTSPDFNQYRLDTLKKAWQYLGRDKIESINPAQKTTSNRQNLIIENTDRVQKDTIVPNESYINRITEFEKKKPVKPIKAKIQNYRFDIDILPEEFPELKDYKGIQFEVGPENKNFNDKLYTMEWDDVQLSNHTPGKNYKIIFTKNGKPYEFIVYPVYDIKDSLKVLAQYQKKFIAYEKELKKRIEEEKNILLAKEAERKQSELERNKILEMQKKSDSDFMIDKAAVNYYSVMRVFTISNFGIYNCDFASMYPNRITLSASFSLNNAQFYPEIVYMLDAQKNTLFYHHHNNFDKFFYNPTSKHILFTILPENKIAIFSSEDFKKINKVNGKYQFEMNSNNKAFSTMAELKEFLLSNQK